MSHPKHHTVGCWDLSCLQTAAELWAGYAGTDSWLNTSLGLVLKSEVHNAVGAHSCNNSREIGALLKECASSAVTLHAGEKWSHCEKKKHPCTTSYRELEQYSREMPALLLTYFSQCVTSCSANRGQALHAAAVQGKTCPAHLLQGPSFSVPILSWPSSHQQPATSRAEGVWKSLDTLSSQSRLALPLHPKTMNKVRFAAITFLTGLALSMHKACTSFRSAPGQELRDVCYKNEFLGLILISAMVGWTPKYSMHLPSRSDAILTFPSSDLLAACKTWLKGTSCTLKQEDSIKNKYIQKQKENKLTELQAVAKRCHLVSKQDLNKMNSTTGKILMRLNWLQHPVYKGRAALQFLLQAPGATSAHKGKNKLSFQKTLYGVGKGLWNGIQTGRCNRGLANACKGALEQSLSPIWQRSGCLLITFSGGGMCGCAPAHTRGGWRERSWWKSVALHCIWQEHRIFPFLLSDAISSLIMGKASCLTCSFHWIIFFSFLTTSLENAANYLLGSH